MNDHPVISIIIPVYDVAPYLGPCIESVLDQTFRDFELILVDDGSQDGSGTLCDQYAARDPRVRVIHKSHGGVSSARNAGVDKAQGDYLGFVDGDDWIEPDMYALLYNNSVAYDADLSACGFVKIDDYDAIRFHSPYAAPECYTPEEALGSMFLKDGMRYSACNKLFRRKLFDTVRYPEWRLLEDKGTTYKLIDLSVRIVWCSSPKYHYFMRPGSIMHSASHGQDLDLFAVNDELLRFIETKYPLLTQTARVSYASECLRLLLRMKNHHHFNPEVFGKCMACIRQNRASAMTAASLSLDDKLMFLMALACPTAFRGLKAHDKTGRLP